MLHVSLGDFEPFVDRLGNTRRWLTDSFRRRERCGCFGIGKEYAPLARHIPLDSARIVPSPFDFARRIDLQVVQKNRPTQRPPDAVVELPQRNAVFASLDVDVVVAVFLVVSTGATAEENDAPWAHRAPDARDDIFRRVVRGIRSLNNAENMLSTRSPRRTISSQPALRC